MRPVVPAFPVPGDWLDMGMTLRDYFAAQALEGDFAAQSSETGEWLDNTPDDFLEKRAQLYYRMADAMVKARDTI